MSLSWAKPGAAEKAIASASGAGQYASHAFPHELSDNQILEVVIGRLSRLREFEKVRNSDAHT